MFCQNCGVKINADAAFCASCGTPLSSAARAQPDFDRRPGLTDHFQNASDTITEKLGIDKIDGFSFKKFFSETFRHHDPDEVEQRLSVGTMDTTPALHSSMGTMPNPWIFFRVLTGALIAYLVFLYGYKEFNNINLVPGLIIIGSFAVPFSTLILFFELNTPKNISLIKILQMVIAGGTSSLFISLFIFEITPFLGFLGASAAGIVEEIGKLAALLFVLRLVRIERYNYRLNWLLFGAAVGTGFASFESAGYALHYGLSSVSSMLEVIQTRGILAPFGHIAWTAIAATAYWVARSHYDSFTSTVVSTEFLKFFTIPVALHFIWNLPFEGPFMSKYIFLGFVAWVVIISFVQTGLKEVADAAATPKIS